MVDQSHQTSSTVWLVWHASINEAFLTPPVVLQHGWDLSSSTRHVHISLVAGSVCVCTRAAYPHHMLDLVCESTQMCTELQVMLEQRIQGCADVLEILALVNIVHCTSDIEH